MACINQYDLTGVVSFCVCLCVWYIRRAMRPFARHGQGGGDDNKEDCGGIKHPKQIKGAKWHCLMYWT